MNTSQAPSIQICNEEKEEIMTFEANGDIYHLGKKINIAKDIAQAFTYTITELSGHSVEELTNKIVQEKLKEDRERIFKEIDWYFKTTDYKEVLVSDLQNIINSDTDVTN